MYQQLTIKLSDDTIKLFEALTDLYISFSTVGIVTNIVHDVVKISCRRVIVFALTCWWRTCQEKIKHSYTTSEQCIVLEMELNSGNVIVLIDFHWSRRHLRGH